MEFIDKTETRKRVKEILEWIYRVLTHSNLYLIKKINAYEIDDDTDLTSLATLNRKNKSTAKLIHISMNFSITAVCVYQQLENSTYIFIS